MRIRTRRLCALVAVTLTATVLSTGISTSASTAEPGDPPEPVGVTPVSQDAATHLGSLVGNNGSSLATCTVNGRNLLTITGDFTAYREPDSSVHPADKAVAIDADTGVFVWGATSVNGWVHTSACANGRMYFGGTFTSFMGVSRARTAAVDATTFGLTPWQSSFGSGAAWNIKSSSDGDMYVAGLDVVRRVTGDTGTTKWSRGFDCGVRTVLPVGNSVYVGGVFDAIKRPGTTSQPAQGLAVLDSATGAPLSAQPSGSVPNVVGCNWAGANPLSLAYDTQRDNLFVCEGGGENRARSVDITTGETVWYEDNAGDGQVCVGVQGFVFDGFHRSGANLVIEDTPHWGTMGIVRNGDNGTQAIWEPSPDFAGAGANRDLRNNGIIGAAYANDYLYVTGGFKSVSGQNKLGIAAFPVGDQPVEEPEPDPDPGCGAE